MRWYCLAAVVRAKRKCTQETRDINRTEVSDFQYTTWWWWVRAKDNCKHETRDVNNTGAPCWIPPAAGWNVPNISVHTRQRQEASTRLKAITFVPHANCWGIKGCTRGPYFDTLSIAYGETAEELSMLLAVSDLPNLPGYREKTTSTLAKSSYLVRFISGL